MLGSTMEPVTHMLTGACLARAGFNRRARYAVLAMTLAAEAPDLDVFYQFGGPLRAFQHHRGWTHSLLGLPLEAAVVVGAVALFHFGSERWKRRPGAKQKRHLHHEKAPLRWFELWLFSLLALLSHIFLDWTNNYGVRPFAPFNPHWYEGSFVFIFEPVIFALLVAGLVLPWVFSLTDSEVGVRSKPFRGRGLAIAALVGVVAVWGYRWLQHDKAEEIARTTEYQDRAPILKMTLSAYPINPYRWYAVVETPAYFQTGVVDTRTGEMETTPQDLFWKPQTTLATLAAKRSWLGHIYLDWSQYPLVVDEGPAALDGPDAALHKVTFRDLRFMFDNVIYDGRQKPVLTGTAYVNADNKVVRIEMDHKEQKGSE